MRFVGGPDIKNGHEVVMSGHGIILEETVC